MKKSKRKLKKKFILIIIGILVVLLAAIAMILFSKDNSKLDKNSESKVVEESKEQPKLKILDLDDNSRPYAVMINNVGAVWPYQSGVMDAYMVYEMLVEGGITREMALYKNTDTEKIASVRSSRHYYLDYVLENDAIYVHWGWSPQAQSDISTLGINNINGLTYSGSYFFRDKSLKVSLEHTGYTTMEALKKATEKLKYRSTTETKPLLNYNVEEVDLSDKEAQDATEVSIKFSSYYTAKFVYDEASGLYKKYQNSTLMKDYTSGEEYTTKNIITYQVEYGTIANDEKGRQNISNTGSGTGYFISSGKAVPITWEKKDRSSRTVYKYKDGTELVVNDGNTFIEIQPKGQNLTITGSTNNENTGA